MSLSANDGNGAFARGPSSGKTPPPAPSAVYAKRLAETQMQARYRPPALRALASGGSPPNEGPPSVTSTAGDGSTLPPTNYPPGFRRPRAGTLPSNVHLAAQRFAATSNTSTTPSSVTASNSTVSLADQRQAPVGPTATSTSLAPPRPTLRHATSVASTVATSAVTERNSRLRSGSLTLPSGGLSNAFGPSIFSSSWLSSTANGNGNGFAVLDELRSVNSVDSGPDDFGVHTLDYLGLDDTHHHHHSRHAAPPAATISELRSQAQQAIAGNLANPNRTRANTVSVYRARPGPTASLLPTPAAEEEEEYFENYDDYNRQQLGYDDSYGAQDYMAKGYKPNDHLVVAATRPRAISVGILDDPVRLQRRVTTTDVPSYLNELQHSNSNLASYSNNLGNSSGALKAEKITPSRSSPGVHYSNGGSNTELPIGRGASAYLLAPSAQQNRSVSPKSENQNNQTQTPTRSLWIGNLDSSVTSEQLIHIFAPYGAIESLRLLPEKECGFVNFVDQADAIRAKEDVLNRLGGNIGMPNGQTVRIGFGKADSAPVAPAKGSNANAARPTSPNTAAKTNSNASSNNMDAQLQSTPTRALWIGSIPSTTTPATILSVFSPYGPIESARVLTHKNCGFINFERLDDAVRARKALNGRDVLGSDVGAIRIGFAKVPTKNSTDGTNGEENANVAVQGVGDLSVGATIHALRGIKGASTIPTDQQVLGGAVDNYRSHLLLSMVGSGLHTNGYTTSVTEQQMIMRELSGGSPDAEPEIQALAEFRPPTMYYTTIPLVSERQHNRRWDASKLRELRKRLDSGTMTTEEVDQVAADFLDGEIVDLASDWLGNTASRVVQKLFEKCSQVPRLAMLERICPSLAMIGIHKNGTWAAQKIIDCAQTPEEVALIAQNLRAYAPPLLLDQFGNYVVQCCLRFGYPSNDFIFDAMVDRMWEVAQGRFGARSMRACLESPHITINQQRRIGTAVILNSIPLATNPNGALLLTWLLDTSGFPSRYNLLAPRFTPHLSHLCTHKLASLTVLRIVNQKIEPEASHQVVEALFSSPGDHVLTDVLGDQVNGVAVVHKILTSVFLDPVDKQGYIEATKRVLIELKVIATQAYRRLIEEVGLPVPNFQPSYTGNPPPTGKPSKVNQNMGVPGLPQGYPNNDQGLASMMAALQMAGQNPQAGPPQLHVDSQYANQAQPPRRAAAAAPPPQMNMMNSYSPSDPFNPFAMNSPQASSPRQLGPRRGLPPVGPANPNYGGHSPNLGQGMNLMAMNQPGYGPPMPPQQPVPSHMYQQQYMYSPYQQAPSPMGNYHA